MENQVMQRSVIISVYGMFNEIGECLYVGQSSDPTLREKVHKLWLGKHVRMRVFRRVANRMEAIRVEKAYIVSFRGKSQAKYNREKIAKPFQCLKISKAQHSKLSFAAATMNKSVQECADGAINLWYENNRRHIDRLVKEKQQAFSK